MTRKRSAYRPRPVISDPLSLLRPASKQARAGVMLRFLSALALIERGSHPGEAEWRDLSDAINTLETLCAQHLLQAPLVMPVVSAAIAGMVAAAARFKAGKGMRLDSPGLQSLREIVDLYGQCLELFTERQMAAAQAETQRRVHALIRSRTPSTQVISL